jgi:uncharacterized protein with PQ loop repeat
MISRVQSWLRTTVEWHSWGYNALTISFIATVAFTLFQAWGLWKQIGTMRVRRSGESISLLLFSYLGCVFFSMLYYGLLVRSIAAVFNGLLGFLHVVVVVLLWRYKRIARAEMMLAATFPLMIVAMVVVPWRDTLLLVVMAISLVPMAHQPLEMWRNRSAGAVDLRYVAIFMASAGFWTIYALAIGNWVLSIINPAIAAILVITALLYVRFRPPAAARAAATDASRSV